ncbi:MAG: gliding motility-associated C-terminal domain-containing protein [Bacteroidetes bacterium]|nr:gliding motility-associated C-terminal domain-containing protein [Bacteroidota bacterium]
MKLFFSILVLFFLSLTVSFSQNQIKRTNIWYFGNKAGLDFSSGSPVVIGGGQLFSAEGCATISDVNGNFLFSTNGVNVWNKNQTIMPGSLVGLWGDVSTSQGVVIVPKPCDPNIYYIFNQEGCTGGSCPHGCGYTYSTVDMTLQSGLGDVSSANNVLINYKCAEWSSAVHHANGNDVWVMTHDSTNKFFAFLVTSAGVQAPVITSISPGLSGCAIGYLKFSPDGSKVFFPSLGYMFDFNTTTGVVSNPLNLSLVGNYGSSFSPDNSRLYVVNSNNLYQYDMLAGTPAQIVASKTLISPVSASGGIHTLQNALDGKIYISVFNMGMDVINNPNALGVACNYSANAIALTTTWLGLTNFIESYFDTTLTLSSGAPIANAGPDVTICTGGSATLTASGGGNYSWNTGQSTSSIIVSPTSASNYTVSVSNACGNNSDSVNVVVQPCPSSTQCPAFVNPDFEGGPTGWGIIPTPWTICQTSPDGYTGLGGTPCPHTGGASHGTDYVGAAGGLIIQESFYQVLSTPLTAGVPCAFTIDMATGSDSCSLTFTGYVEVYGSTSGCGIGTNLLWTSPAITNIPWQTYTVSFTPTANFNTISFVARCGNCGGVNYVYFDNIQCTAVVSTPTITATGNSICSGSCTTIASSVSGGSSPYTYSWNPGGQTTSSISACPTSNTTYTITVTDANNSSSIDTAIVSVTQTPAAVISGAATLCSGQNITLAASGGNNYSWNTGQTTSSITSTLTSTSTFTVIVSNGNCADTTSATVSVFPLPFVNASPNVTVCPGSVVTLSANGNGNYSWSTGQTTSAIFISPTATTSYSVSTSNSCGTSTDSVMVTVSNSITASVSGNTTICAGDIATLTASGGINYSWSTGQTTSSITATATATYSVIASSGNCADTVSVTVIVAPPPVANANSATICAGETATLTASGGGNYLWSTGQTTAAVAMAAAGSYSVIVTIGSCSDTAYANVIVNPLPTASAGTDITITQGQTTTLIASGGGNYLWSNGETTVAAAVSPAVTTVYCVTVTNSFGCSDSDCVTVFVKIEPVNCDSAGELFLPNAFSPNGDGENDELKIYYGSYDCLEKLHIVIYNRWGEKVFESSDPQFKWDGIFKNKIMDSSVLAYILEINYKDGSQTRKAGNVSVIR